MRTNIRKQSTVFKLCELTALVKAEHPDRLIASAADFAWIDGLGKLTLAANDSIAKFAAGLLPKLDPATYRDTGLVLLRHCNAYVNTGLNNALDREWGIGTSNTVSHIGVDSNTTAVTASTVFLHGTGAGTAASTIIKAISPAATRTAQTTTGGATFVNADFTSGVFVWNKVGLLAGTSTDAGTGLVDVVGGTGGSSPYNRTFSLDLTAAGTFSVTAQIAVTATAV